MKIKLIFSLIVLFSIFLLISVSAENNTTEKENFEVIDKTNKELTKEIVLEKNLHEITSWLFRLEKKEITLEKISIIFFVTLFIILILNQVIVINSSFNKITSILTSAGLTSILGFSGGIKNVSKELIEIGNHIPPIEKIILLKIIMIFIFLSIIYFITSKTLKKILCIKKLRKAATRGEKAGMKLAELSAMSKKKY